jgi:hypothetical protein
MEILCFSKTSVENISPRVVVTQNNSIKINSEWCAMKIKRKPEALVKSSIYIKANVCVSVCMYVQD